MMQRRLRLSMQDNVWEHAIVVKKSECYSYFGICKCKEAPEHQAWNLVAAE